MATNKNSTKVVTGIVRLSYEHVWEPASINGSNPKYSASLIIPNGWMSANDIRELENLDRIPAEDGGDLYLINGNMLPLQHAGAFADNLTTEEKEEEPDEEQEVLGVEKSGSGRKRTGRAGP